LSQNIIFRSLYCTFIATIFCLATTCTTSPGAPSSLGVSASAARPSSVNLRLAKADGQVLEVAQLRGKKVLLFLFATYDLGSQAALEPLVRFLKKYPAVSAVGIALQPDAAKFLPMYADYWSLTFPLTFDSEKVIIPGLSDLGPVAAIPAFILLDEKGVIVARITGAATEQQLDGLLRAVQ
jgi:peroxiredoxin